MICQLMIRDFMFQHGEEGYDKEDLRIGIAYCRGLLDDGWTEEPFHGYDLRAFIAWAEQRLTAA